MRIIWASKYRTFSLDSGLGIAIILCILAIAIAVGFLSGKVYEKTTNSKSQLTPIINSHNNNLPPIVNISSDNLEKHQNQAQSALSVNDTELQIKALANILAELQAKLVTMQTLQKELNDKNPNKTPSKLGPQININMPKTSTNFLGYLLGGESGMGGVYEPVEKALNPNPTLDALINQSAQTLTEAYDFESELLSGRYNFLQNENNFYFVPSVIPAKARVSSLYGIRIDPLTYTYAMHRGIDFAGAVGTPIYAVASGVVEAVRSGGDYGHHIELRHTPELTSLYGHCSKLLVTEGEVIQKGQLIALMGASGRASGSHLHLEIRINGEPVNPGKFIDVSSINSQ